MQHVQFIVFGATLAALSVVAATARADSMLGGAGAAYATPEGANANPANAAWVDRSQIDWHPELYKNDTLNVRYPGYETTTKANSGVGSGLLGNPGFIYKMNPRLGIGGYIVPPLPIELEIKAEKIPVVVLGAQSFVDIIGKGTLGGLAHGVAGYRITDNFGVGLSMHFMSVNFEGDLIPSEGGKALAHITLSLTEIVLNSGIRWDAMPGKFAVGLAFGLAKITNTETVLDSPLLSGAAGEEGESGPVASTVPLNSILVGIQYVLNPKIRILADVQYDRVDKEAEGQSLVDFKKKRKDVYDTVSPRFGAILSVVDGGHILLGGRYDPASVGAGSLGDDPSVGFGTLDLVMIFMGQGVLTPSYQLGGGMQKGFGAKYDTNAKGKKTGKAFYTWTVGAGFTYRYASLGIDVEGELPGAYQQKTFGIPASVTYRF